MDSDSLSKRFRQALDYSRSIPRISATLQNELTAWFKSVRTDSLGEDQRVTYESALSLQSQLSRKDLRNAASEKAMEEFVESLRKIDPDWEEKSKKSAQRIQLRAKL